MATKEAYYFSHDSNARNDEKLLQLRAVYKSEGYGWYWILVEMLRDANAYRLHYDGKYSFKAIAKELDSDEDLTKQFIDDCIHEFDLFELEDGYFYSKSLNRRMATVEEKREKARQSANKRWERNADAMPTHSDSNAIKERKVKEKKEKKNPPLSPQGASDVSPLEGLPEWENDFDWFWLAYGKKTSRSKCEQKFKNLSSAERVAIKQHVPKYVASTPDNRYRKNPETYLNQRTWEDEYLPGAGGITPGDQEGALYGETTGDIKARFKMVY